jgi:uncharacterized membrane protein YhaH (DUF805 family)
VLPAKDGVAHRETDTVGSMPIVVAVKTGFINYLNFRTRARRSDFWWWFLFVIAGELILNGISKSVANIFGLATLVPHVMFGIRRMHDTNRRGWWCLVPIVNLVFWAQPGTEGENRFGPPPPPLSA